MCGNENKINETQDAYKKKIQDFNQLKWQDDPISIEELVFSNYDDKSAIDGDKPKKEIVFIDTDFDLGLNNGIATAIQQVIEQDMYKDDTFYTLQGVKVSKPTTKGVYIHNGKKVLIK